MLARPAIAQTLGRDDRAYWARRQRAGAFRANNPAVAIHERFTRGGVVVRTRGGSVSLSLRTPGAARRTQPAPVARRNRVSYDEGAVRAWYANGPLGLEQGFDVARASAATRASRRLILGVRLRLSGGLHARLAAGAQRITIAAPGARPALTYGQLLATDARGRMLPARLRLHRGELRIEIRSAGAAFPIHVDPFLSSGTLTASTPAQGDELGYSVATDGSTIVVGAPRTPSGDSAEVGAAYVFAEPKTGWADATQTAELTASDGAQDAQFGNSVTIAGGTIVVGAPGASVAQPGQGIAYVFAEPQSGWKDATQSAELIASNPQEDASLGNAVAISFSGSTIVAGAWQQDGSNGAAYVYSEPAGGWADAGQTAVLTPSDAAAQGDEEFGTSVAISGTTIVAGAPDGGSNAGDFLLGHDGCSGTTVAPGASCTVQVSFAPTAGGVRSAQLSFADNASGGPQAVSLSGIGSTVGTLSGTVVDAATSKPLDALVSVCTPSTSNARSTTPTPPVAMWSGRSPPGSTGSRYTRSATTPTRPEPRSWPSHRVATPRTSRSRRRSRSPAGSRSIRPAGWCALASRTSTGACRFPSTSRSTFRRARNRTTP
jgi:hypothetical protein